MNKKRPDQTRPVKYLSTSSLPPNVLIPLMCDRLETDKKKKLNISSEAESSDCNDEVFVNDCMLVGRI